MSFLMGSTTVAIPKPHFSEDRGKGTTKRLLPPPFTESFNSSFAPQVSTPSGFLPWFQPEKPVFRQKRDHAPAKPIQSSQKPWMTGEIMCEIRKKHSLLQTAKNEDTYVAWNEFKQQRSLVSQLLRDAKFKHEINIESYLDKRDKSYYCDTCDRGYTSQKELQEHSAEHIYCSIDGCSFEAHPKVVALHRKMQHDTGLAGKIMSLDTPEDIKKWREERRRNYPTAANVVRRKKEAAEKQSRGELLDSKYLGKMKGKFSPNCDNQFREPFERRGRGRGQRGRGKRRRSRPSRGRGRDVTLNEDFHAGNNASDVKRRESLPSHDVDETDDEDTNGNLKRFKGTLTNYENEELILKTQRMLEAHEDVEDGTKPSKRLKHQDKLNRVSDISAENNAVDSPLDSSLPSGRNKEFETSRVTIDESQRNSPNDNSWKERRNQHRSNFSKRTNRMLCKEEIRPKHQYFDVLEVASAEKRTDKLVNPSCLNSVSSGATKNAIPELRTTEQKPDSVQVETTNVLPSPKPFVSTQTTNRSSTPKPVMNEDELEDGEIVDSDEEILPINDTAERNNVAMNTSSTVPDELGVMEINKLPSFFVVNENEVSDEEVETPVKEVVLEKPSVRVGGALGSLISNYGTDSDSEGEIKDEPSTHSQQAQPATKRNDVVRRVRPAPDMFPISRRRVTLLEKLLRNEIRRERNIILQCVHYIVRNDFFGVETATDH